MTPSAFSYARPTSLDDAIVLLHDHGSDARVLAGGQSLIPLLAQRALRPRWVIDISRIPGLDRIESLPAHIRMGARVTQEQARVSPVVRAEVCGLSEALEWVASPVIRERGTVVGNLVANGTGTELPAVAIALGALFAVRDRGGERLVEATELLRFGAQFAPQALVTHVLWPRASGHGGFYEVARRDGHAAVVGALVSVSRYECRVALCGVTAVGIACPSVARAIFETFPAVPASADINHLLARDLETQSGSPAVPATAFTTAFVDAAYRRDVAPVVIQRAVAAAALSVERQ